MNGATSLMKRTRITCTSHTVCRGSSMMRNQGCTITGNRYYDPLQGRYITQDPIGLAGGWNLYNYPLNPIIRMDPLGLYNLYQLLYDVWHDDSYGTSSIDITGSGDLISLGVMQDLALRLLKRKVKCYLIFVFMLQHADMQELVVG
ncbi:Rhs element protein [Escherichia coli]|nr:Rhs element protein [Escherichia coli]